MKQETAEAINKLGAFCRKRMWKNLPEKTCGTSFRSIDQADVIFPISEVL